MGLELTPDRHSSITSQTRYPLCHATTLLKIKTTPSENFVMFNPVQNNRLLYAGAHFLFNIYR